MTKANTLAAVRHDVFEMLITEGFRPEWGNDGDITLKYQGSTIWLEWFGEDAQYTRVLLPNFWPIESADELQRALRAASVVNHRCKAVKIAVVGDTNAWASVEYVASPADAADPKLMLRRLRFIDHGL
jgi:hypothetical protein